MAKNEVFEAHEDYDKMFKVLIVGESGVGKSSLMLRYVDDIFTGMYISTIGVDFKSKTIQVNKHRCKIQIWDTAGQERFRVITSTYYRGADAIILVYDVTNRSSFERISYWMQEINLRCVDFAPIMILAANKTDCSDHAVTVREGEELSETMCSPFFQTSARTGQSIEMMFQCTAEMILEKQLNTSQNSIGNTSRFRSLTNMMDPFSNLVEKLHLSVRNQNKRRKISQCCN